MTGRILTLLAILVFVISMGCSKEKEITSVTPEPETYAGSSACSVCHASIYSDYTSTGHHHMLNAIIGGLPPVYPDTVPALPGPPGGYGWSDIAYVVGGFGWKARFVDSDGYVVTGGNVQWNLETGQWAPYEPATPEGTKPYDCGGCHTTGFVASDTLHQGGRPGIMGTWAEDGIGCERCHGAGGQHRHNPRDIQMQVDNSSELCGECHYGTADHRILASGGLIKDEAQYDELTSAGHGHVRCVTCHNPHRSAKYDPDNAIIIDCTTACHFETVNHVGPDDCVLCHMPKSVLGAVSSGSGVHLRGDMRSHIFRINADTTQAQFYSDGGQTYSYGFNGLNFACLSSCHDTRDLAWAASHAGEIHQ